MGRSKLSMQEKARALALLEQGMSAIRIAADLQVTRRVIYSLKKAAATHPPGTVPQRIKPGSGAPKKTSTRTDKILKREVMSDPCITAVSLKQKHPALLKNVAVRTVQHRLQKDLKMPARRAAKKPLLTEAMKKKRIDFCKKSKDWTSEQWQKDEPGVCSAGPDSASSSARDPSWSGCLRNREKIGQNSSDECLHGNEPEVYIDVAEHPEDSRNRKHSMVDDEESKSVSDGRKYIKNEDNIGVKIEISQEYLFDECLGDQDTMKYWNEVEDVNIVNIKQEPDDGGIESSR
ncbi:uncharacterized protein LOC143022442 [Oratosquilla oratoria]|uniref:uncharacterized protein LOC143022442 n=1 Tax=Oratosquilla oratoria TaxID=337810 RepID=UPI003F763112